MRLNGNSLNFQDVVLQDFWIHFAGLIVIVFGILDLWYFKQLAHDSDLLFVIGGVAGMGLKIANGATAQLRQVALNTAFASQRMAQAADAVASGTPVVVPGTAGVVVVPPVVPKAGS